MMHKAPELPLVSVCCITYNHEAYLAQAIESVLMQETSFAVEMVIGEDCSTDGTRQLALEYQRRYPGRVRVLLPAQNLGVMPNFLATLEACTGRYIALLDGDDYWTSPLKLQQQVEVLEAQPGCAMCVHDAEAFTQDNAQPSYLFSVKYPWLPKREGAISQAELAKKGWGIPTASMVFRRDSVMPLPAWFRHVFSGDYTLQLLSSRHGYIYYLPAVMARYRLHGTGVARITQHTLAQNEKRIFENQQFKRLLPEQSQEPIDQYLEHLYFERSELMGKAGNRLQQATSYVKAVTVSRQRLGFHLRRLAKKVVGVPA